MPEIPKSRSLQELLQAEDSALSTGVSTIADERNPTSMGSFCREQTACTVVAEDMLLPTTRQPTASIMLQGLTCWLLLLGRWQHSPPTVAALSHTERTTTDQITQHTGRHTVSFELHFLATTVRIVTSRAQA